MIVTDKEMLDNLQLLRGSLKKLPRLMRAADKNARSTFIRSLKKVSADAQNAIGRKSFEELFLVQEKLVTLLQKINTARVIQPEIAKQATAGAGGEIVEIPTVDNRQIAQEFINTKSQTIMRGLSGNTEENANNLIVAILTCLRNKKRQSYINKIKQEQLSTETVLKGSITAEFNDLFKDSSPPKLEEYHISRMMRYLLQRHKTSLVVYGLVNERVLLAIENEYRDADPLYTQAQKVWMNDGDNSNESINVMAKVWCARDVSDIFPSYDSTIWSRIYTVAQGVSMLCVAGMALSNSDNVETAAMISMMALTLTKAQRIFSPSYLQRAIFFSTIWTVICSGLLLYMVFNFMNMEDESPVDQKELLDMARTTPDMVSGIFAKANNQLSIDALHQFVRADGGNGYKIAHCLNQNPKTFGEFEDLMKNTNITIIAKEISDPEKITEIFTAVNFYDANRKMFSDNAADNFMPLLDTYLNNAKQLTENLLSTFSFHHLTIVNDAIKLHSSSWSLSLKSLSLCWQSKFLLPITAVAVSTGYILKNINILKITYETDVMIQKFKSFLTQNVIHNAAIALFFSSYPLYVGYQLKSGLTSFNMFKFEVGLAGAASLIPVLSWAPAASAIAAFVILNEAGLHLNNIIETLQNCLKGESWWNRWFLDWVIYTLPKENVVNPNPYEGSTDIPVSADISRYLQYFPYLFFGVQLIELIYDYRAEQKSTDESEPGQLEYSNQYALAGKDEPPPATPLDSLAPMRDMKNTAKSPHTRRRPTRTNAEDVADVPGLYDMTDRGDANTIGGFSFSTTAKKVPSINTRAFVFH